MVIDQQVTNRELVQRCLTEGDFTPSQDQVHDDPFPEATRAMITAHQQEGVNGAREVWNRLIDVRPALSEWFSPADKAQSGWEIRSLQEACQPKLPRKYLVENLIAKGSLNILYGYPGSMKTLLALDMGLSVASGTDFLPEGPVEKGRTLETNQAPVLFLDQDNGSDELARRLHALVKGKGVGESVPFTWISMPSPLFNAQTEVSFDWLVNLVEANEIEMIFLDNLGTVSGNADENSVEMANVMARFRKLADETNCAITILHHQRKQEAESRQGNVLRGHTSIEAALDLAMLSQKKPNQYTVLTTTKFRFLPETEFAALFTYEHKDRSRDLKTAAFKRFSDDSDPILIRAKQIIRSKMANGMNQSEIVAIVRTNSDIGKPTARQALKELRQEGVLDRDTDSRGAYRYMRA